jgi:hypothetical protein
MSHFQRARFNPSPYSDAATGTALVETGTTTPLATGTPAAVPAGTPEEDSLSAYSQYLPAGAEFVRGFLFGSADEPEVIEAKIANYRKAMRSAKDIPFLGIPVPGSKGWYRSEIAKLEAKLAVARRARAEAEKTQAVANTVKILTAVGAVAGVVILGALAVNQVQRARLQQLEIKMLKEQA